MATDPGDNQDELSEEEKTREAINKLIEDLNESLKDQGVSEKIREAKINTYKDLLNQATGNSRKLKDVQNSINIEIEGSTNGFRDFGVEIETIVSRLNEVVESITNQSDLSQRILGTFKKTRQVANIISDDADLSYVRSIKYMGNQSDILSIQEKRLEAQALEGAQALQLINTSNKSAQIQDEIQRLETQKNEAIQTGNDDLKNQLETRIQSLVKEEEKISLTDIALDKAREGKKLSEEEIASLKTYTTTSENLSETDKKRILSAIEFNNELVEGVGNFKALQNAIDKSIEREKELNKRMGLTGAIMSSFSKIPGFSSIFKSEDVEDVKNLAREALVEQKRLIDEATKARKGGNEELAKGLEDQAKTVGLTSKTAIMGKLVEKSFGNLKEALTDPAAIFTFLVTKGLQFNSEVTDLSKNLGVTETQATKIRNEFTSISANTMDTAINTERLLKAQSDLNKELSLGVQFSGDTLVNFARLTEKIGLSAQQAAKLTLTSASTGESATEFAGKSALAAAQQAKTLGITVNMKEIMSDTADLTNEQLILFGRQPEVIGKTLAEVKKLGIELGDLNAISSKLLDFQGSIESELEAELLTGKQLNLERARAAALAGDQATLAREIASQVGTISEFESMNVLQRQKLAESLGMNVNQLSGVLIRQEAINKGIADAKDLTDEQLAAAQKLKDSGQAETLAEAVVQIQEQRSAQDKFNDAVIKLQRLFGELLGGPVGELLDALVDVASVVIGPIAAALNFILTPVKALTTLLTKVPNILKVIGVGLLALNFSSIQASVGGIITKIGGLGKSIGGLVSKAGDLGTKLVSGLSSGGEGLKGFFNGIKDSFTGVQNQAAGIEFDPRMAGGGRFRDMTSGRMVSEEAANAAGVFKPGTEPIPSPVPNLAEGTDDIADIPAVADDGSMLKEKMKNIAEGLKAFASMEVVKGAIALTIASPGLFVLSKAADGLNKLGEVKGEALQEAMSGIAKGVEEFGTVKVVLGSIGLLIASPGLVLLSMSVGGLKNLSDVGAEDTQEAMGGLAEGIGEFSSISVIAGAIGLTIASPGLVLLGVSTKGLKSLSEIDADTTKKAMGSIAGGIGKFASMTVIGGAIGLTLAAPGLLLLGASSLGLKVLDSIKPKKVKTAMASIAQGISKFANPKAILGGLALIPISLALATMAVGAIGLGAIALLGAPAAAGMAALTAGLTALGTAAATGVPFLGVALIGAFGLALIPFGAALGMAAPAIEAIGTVIASTIMAIADAVVTVIPALTQSLIDLSNNVSISGLLGLAVTLPLLAGGLALFGAALIPIGLASIGLLMVGKALKPIAEIAPKLNLANTAIKGIATSIALLATSLNTLDAAKLETLSDFEGNINISTVTTSTTDQASVATNTADQVNTIASTINEPVSSLANLITKQSTPDNTEIIPGISVTTPPTTTTQEVLTTNTENLAATTSNATTSLEEFTAKVNASNLTERTKQQFIDAKSRALGVNPYTEEKVKLFKTQSPETSDTIESPKPPSSKQTEDSQVFIDNIQPMIAETVTSTINAMLPPMVAALKEGQGKVKVVNDSFNSSGQKGDINTIRRLPSDNFA